MPVSRGRCCLTSVHKMQKSHSVQKSRTPTSSAKELALISVIFPRPTGPGGYYNTGSLLGLVAGTDMQIMHPAGDGPIGRSQPVGNPLDQFAVSPSAIALSLAMLIFFSSGEVDHRACSNGFPPDACLNGLGDVLSGVGTIFLGIGLLITGRPLLAASAGLLHATLPDQWRSLVLASRAPALLAATLTLATKSCSASAATRELIFGAISLRQKVDSSSALSSFTACGPDCRTAGHSKPWR